MPTSIEDLVRAAQHEQAERAPDPRAILAALPRRRAQVVQRRRLTLAAAAVAVAAVAAVPVFALRQGSTPQRPSVTPTVPVAPSVQTEPLHYSPDWVPEGYAEYSRASWHSPGLTRTWASAPPKSPLLLDDVKHRLTMTVTPTAEAEVTIDPSDEPVKINKSNGHYRTQGPPGAYWQLNGYTIEIRADQPGLSKAAVLKMARSVRPDAATWQLPFGIRLAGKQAFVSRTVSGTSPTDWLADTSITDNGADLATVTIGTAIVAPEGGDSLQVAGHPARFQTLGDFPNPTLDLESPLTPPPGRYLVVDLGAGVELSVYSEELEQPALVALAEATSPPAPAAVSWIGS